MTAVLADGSASPPTRDTFVCDNLPLAATLPHFNLESPRYSYPERLNAAAVLIDTAIADGHGTRTAIINDCGSWTYAELGDLAARIAGLIETEGLVPGSRVLLRGPNTATLIACWLGAIRAGCVAVTTVPLLRGPDLAPIVTRASPLLALIDARTVTAMGGVEWIEAAGCRTLTFDGDFGDGELERRLKQQPPSPKAHDSHRDDPALLAFTSGTTGVPKATVQFHRDLLIPADGFSASALEPSPEDRFCSSAPIGFTFGLGALVLFPFRARATSVTIERPTATALLETIDRHGVTLLLTAPTAYRTMLSDVGSYDLSSLRLCVSAGEHLPPSTHEAWTATTGTQLVNGIGATEMMHIFIASTPGETPAGSCGHPVPGYEACVLDAAGLPLDSGTGRLAVRGPTGCRYLGDVRQNDYVIDGWNVTGDTYRIDEAGNFWFVARSDDMIVSSGYNIAAPEVEAALASHDAVTESAVIGVPDIERGTVIKAFVVLRRGRQPCDALAHELQDHVKSVIAPYKYPRLVEFVADLPRTPTGKIRHADLR